MLLILLFSSDIIFRFEGDLQRAKMYVECGMCADGEVLMMGVEESIGNSTKSTIHYHLVSILQN